MTPEQHRLRHIELHQALNELIADWILDTERLPSDASVMELMEWSSRQAIKPTHKDGSEV